MRKLTVYILGFFISLNLVSVGYSNETKLLETVPQLDLNKYAGIWYEIASFPQRFQKGCTGTTAEYSLNEDKTVKVINRCFKETLDGPEKVANGKAWIPNPEFPAKLKVQFFWPFSGDYWVIDLDPDYKWAVVGSPSRKYLWLLSRTPQVSDEFYARFLETVKAKDYDITKIQKTLQK